MTTRAAFACGFGALMLIIALTTGAPVYYAMSGAVLIACAIAFVSALTALYTAKCAMSIGKTQVSRGDSVVLSVIVRHFCPFPVAALSFTLLTPQDRTDVTRISASPWPFTVKAVKRRLNCPHRGIYALKITRIESRDVLNLFCFARTPKCAEVTLSVLPHVRDLPPLILSTGDGGSVIYRHASDDTSYPADIRQWLSGDALKRVHWKLTMRKRELMVRTFEAAARPDTLILLDTTPEMNLDVADALCEVAASIAIAQITAGYPVHMPLYAPGMPEIDDASGAMIPLLMDALTRLNFNGVHELSSTLAMEIRRARMTGGIVLITHRLTGALVEEAVRILLSGIKVRLYFVADERNSDNQSLIAKLNEQGVDAMIVDPDENAIDPHSVDLAQ